MANSYPRPGSRSPRAGSCSLRVDKKVRISAPFCFNKNGSSMNYLVASDRETAHETPAGIEPNPVAISARIHLRPWVQYPPHRRNRFQRSDAHHQRSMPTLLPRQQVREHRLRREQLRRHVEVHHAQHPHPDTMPVGRDSSRKTECPLSQIHSEKLPSNRTSCLRIRRCWQPPAESRSHPPTGSDSAPYSTPYRTKQETGRQEARP
jgi:hypothetical protein